MTLTVGSLFSGCGGMDLGLEQAGFRVAWQCEIEPIARSVLAAHWRTVPCYEDVRALRGADLAPVDVIAGGFPCQGVSVAGRRAGLGDPRSALFFDFVRVVEEMREATQGRYPSLALVENNPGLFSSGRGALPGGDMAVVLARLGQRGAAVAYRVLDAQWFGVPQRRERVYFLADYASGDFAARRAAEVFALAAGGSGDSAPRAAARQDVAAPLGTGASAGGGFRYDLDCAGAYVVGSGTRQVASAVTASAGHHGHSSARGDGSDNLVVAAAWDGANITSAANRTRRGFDLPANTLHTAGLSVVSTFQQSSLSGKGTFGFDADAVVAKPAKTQSDGQMLVHRTIAPTVSAKWAKGTGGPSGNEVQNLIPGRTTVRRLTPRECERLQGMPDNWTRWGADGREIADTHRYRLVGNAVCVPVARWIGLRLRAVLEAAS